MINTGIPPSIWARAKREARVAMVRAASQRGQIPYSSLVREIHATRLEAHDVRLFELIGQISTDEYQAGRGMLSAVVVHKTGDMEPGYGFYELAGELGLDTSDRLRCWIGQLHKVHAIWSRQ